MTFNFHVTGWHSLDFVRTKLLIYDWPDNIVALHEWCVVLFCGSISDFRNDLFVQACSAPVKPHWWQCCSVSSCSISPPTSTTTITMPISILSTRPLLSLASRTLTRATPPPPPPPSNNLAIGLRLLSNSRRSISTARSFASTSKRQDFHFDTHHFVQRLEREGLKREQAEGIMTAMAEVIDEAIRNMTSNVVTKAAQEKVQWSYTLYIIYLHLIF